MSTPPFYIRGAVQVQWRQQYGHRPRTDVEDLVRAAKSPTIRPRGASYGLKGPSYFTEGGSERGASVQLDPPVLSKPGGAAGPLQGAMPPPEPAPEAPRSLGPLRKGWGQLAPWLSRGSHDASSATPGAREVPSYAMESPFEGVAPYNVLSNPVAAGRDRIPALYAAGSRGRDAPAPPPAGAEPSLRSEDYNPCVVSSDSGLAVGHQESAADVSQGEIPLHQRAGTVLLKRPRQGQPSGVPGEDYLAALQGPLRHADAVLEPAQAVHAPVRAMEHSVVDSGVAVDAEDVAKQQRKQVGFFLRMPRDKPLCPANRN